MVIITAVSSPYEANIGIGARARMAKPTIDELLDTFETLRRENVATLSAMSPTAHQLTLRGMHPELGPVTLEELLATWVVHDLNHIHQIAKCMAFQYRDNLGPWLEYATVIKGL